MLSGFAVQTDNQLGVGAAKSQVPATIAASCEQQVAAPKVEVGLQEATVVESQQYNIVELSELSKQFNNTHVDEGEVLGLTFFNYGYELELSFPNVVSATSEIICVRPHFNLRVISQEQKVYIAKEHKPKSCEYNTIHRHEYRHVNINETLLRQLVSTLAAEFQSKFGNEIYYGTSDSIKKSIKIDKEEKWLPFIRAILEQQNSLADEQHEQVDTLEEYRKFNFVCSHKYRYVPDE